MREVGLNTPESIDLQRLFSEMLDRGNRACVMEATSMASAKGRLDGTRFAVLVFTNLTQDHLDFHGTMEEYFESKRRLFAQADRAVVNVGDEYGKRLAAELPDAITFGPEDDLGELDLKLPGRFNVENALAAAAAARALGIGEEAIKQGIEAVDRVPGRFDRVDEGQPFAVLRRLCAHAGCSRDRARGCSRARPRWPRDLRVRRRRRSRSGETAAHGESRRRAGGRLGRDVGQST